MSRTFTTAYEERRSTENTSTPVEVRSSGLNEPVSEGNYTNYTNVGLPIAPNPVQMLRTTKMALPALPWPSQHWIQ